MIQERGESPLSWVQSNPIDGNRFSAWMTPSGGFYRVRRRGYNPEEPQEV